MIKLLFLITMLLLGGVVGISAEDGGLVSNTISVNGVNRSYSYFVSTKANSFNGNWVVFALHDNGQTAQQFAEQSGWIKVAEKNSFAVVFPQAVNNTWSPNSGSEDAYIKAVFEHARTNLISRYAGDNAPPVGGLPAGSGGNNPIWAWEPLRDLTGSGAGATVAQEFAMNHPGLFAAVATLNGVAFDAAYAKGNEPSQAYFQYMRAKNIEPVWKQLKKEVPVTVWMFSNGAANAAQEKQSEYWKKSAAVGTTPIKRKTNGFDTTVYQNATNTAQQFRFTQISSETKYDETMSSAIWDDLFCHVARWTSAPNGDLVSVMTEAEVGKNFEVRTIDIGDGKVPYTYYLKLPSSYKPGQKLPLVLVTHGANENAWLFTSKIKMQEVGEKEGFITVYPNGRKNRWESNNPDGPDAKFLEMMIKEVVNKYGADASRVYMMGFSNGSAMTHMMGLTHPQLFAATSPTNGAGTLQKPVQERVDQIKAKFDYRLPVMAVYGNVDSGSTTDGLIPAVSSIRDGINAIKKYNSL